MNPLIKTLAHETGSGLRKGTMCSIGATCSMETTGSIGMAGGERQTDELARRPGTQIEGLALSSGEEDHTTFHFLCIGACESLS